MPANIAASTPNSSASGSVIQQIMDVSSSSMAASIGMTGLLREGWSGISEALAPATTGIMATTPTTLGHLPTTPTTSSNNNNSSGTAPSSTELLELTSRLTRQLKRAEETCRRIEIREKNRVELLKRCLVACCAKESAEVLEMALEIAENDEPDVEKNAQEFKNLLIVRSTPDEQIEIELDRIAQLEKEVKEERSLRIRAEEEKAVLQARLETQQEAWEKERERYYIERRTVEETVKERMAIETQSFAARIKSIEQTNKDRLQLETGKLNEKIRSLEAKLAKEVQINQQKKSMEEQINSDAVRLATNEKDLEIERLRHRVEELEDASRTEREFVSFAKAQATKERVLESLQHRVKELEKACAEKDQQLFDLKKQNQGAVPPEFLGPARGDYLRHVILRYLTFDSLSQKQALIPVIAMLLNFSPDEKKMCEICAARDMAKEGLVGTLTSTFQAMPINTFFSSPASTATSTPNPGRPVASNARYIPVSAHGTTIVDE